MYDEKDPFEELEKKSSYNNEKKLDYFETRKDVDIIEKIKPKKPRQGRISLPNAGGKLYMPKETIGQGERHFNKRISLLSGLIIIAAFFAFVFLVK